MPPNPSQANDASRRFAARKRKAYAPLEKATKKGMRKCRVSSQHFQAHGREMPLQAEPIRLWSVLQAQDEPTRRLNHDLSAFSAAFHSRPAPKAHGLRIFLSEIVGNKAHAPLERWLSSRAELMRLWRGEVRRKASQQSSCAYGARRERGKADPQRSCAFGAWGFPGMPSLCAFGARASDRTEPMRLWSARHARRTRQRARRTRRRAKRRARRTRRAPQRPCDVPTASCWDRRPP